MASKSRGSDLPDPLSDLAHNSWSSCDSCVTPLSSCWDIDKLLLGLPPELTSLRKAQGLIIALDGPVASPAIAYRLSCCLFDGGRLMANCSTSWRMPKTQKILKDRRQNSAMPSWNQPVTGGAPIALFDGKGVQRSFMSFHSDRESTRAGTRGTAVVTGASAGLGRVFAERLAGLGYNLILVARRASKLEELALELRKRYDVAAEPIASDLAASEGVDRIVEYVSVRDDITLLVNNAGTATLGNLSESKPDSLAAMINLNVVALTRLCVAALVAFRSRDTGAIINVGSVLGFHSLPISSIYSGTKGYVLNFTLGIQQEVDRQQRKGSSCCSGRHRNRTLGNSGVPLSSTWTRNCDDR